MGAAHEVGAEQREADGVTRLRWQLQTLLEHLLKRPAVETVEMGGKKGEVSLISIKKAMRERGGEKFF